MKSAFIACLAALQVTTGANWQIATDEIVELEAANIRVPRLTAGTPISLELLSTITAEGKSWKRGDRFGLVVAEPISVGGEVIVPAGTLALGHVRWASGPGPFGKSGKLEIEIDQLVLESEKVMLVGTFRQDGAKAIQSAGTAIAAGPLAVLIAGQRATIPKGSVITAYLGEDLPRRSRAKSAAAPKHSTSKTDAVAGRTSFAEAFKTEIALARRLEPVTSSKRRPTVSEAFRDEIASLGRAR